MKTFFLILVLLTAEIPIFGKILRFIIEYLIRILYSSDISCKAKIGKGFRIMHGHDIVIGANVVIGDYCKIFNGVTLGNKNTEIPDSKQPTLEDNVVISTGVKILGGITIGSNSIVGANSVVLKNIPTNSIAVGIPARVVKSK
jgi:serine O-acetyltransferase